jgi:hypothetical protein
VESARELASRGVVVLLAEPSIGAIAADIDRGSILLRGRVAAVVDGGEQLAHAYEERLGVVA